MRLSIGNCMDVCDCDGSIYIMFLILFPLFTSREIKINKCTLCRDIQFLKYTFVGNTIPRSDLPSQGPFLCVEFPCIYPASKNGGYCIQRYPWWVICWSRRYQCWTIIIVMNNTHRLVVFDRYRRLEHEKKGNYFTNDIFIYETFNKMLAFWINQCDNRVGYTVPIQLFFFQVVSLWHR